MVTQRTEGLYRVFLFCQIIIVAALFWFGVWIMVTFYSEGGALTWGRYSIYCGMLVLGLILETLSRSKNFFLQNELLRPHRLSLRQTAASVGLLVLYLVAAKDAFISRVFLFNFVPWLYIALLFSHYYLPSLLARGIFRREDKTILVGSSQRVAQLREWLERKAEIGLRTVGLISDDDQTDNPGHSNHFARIPAFFRGQSKRDSNLRSARHPLAHLERSRRTVAPFGDAL